MKLRIISLVLPILLLDGCREQEQQSNSMTSAIDRDTSIQMNETAAIVQNPFFVESPLYMNYPQFDLITNEHYLPAFERGMAEHLVEIETIASQMEVTSFENTIIALELAGDLYARVASVFFAMSSAHTNEQIQALAQQLATEIAAHEDAILLNRDLFAKINNLYEQQEFLELDEESKRLLEDYYIDFIRAGAGLDVDEQVRMKELNAQIAVLETQFSQNILSEVNDLAIVVDTREELTGLSEARKDAAAEEAAERGLNGKFVIPLLNTSGQPTLVRLQNRNLRERIHTTSLSRGSRGGEFDNREILSDVIRLRAERAQLLGYANHAEYILENQTAQNVAAVNQRLGELTPAAVANATREASDLQQIIAEDGQDFELASWDWDFYTEKLRVDRYDFDVNQLRPYFELNNVLQKGVFFAAEKLYGITFQAVSYTHLTLTTSDLV